MHRGWLRVMIRYPLMVLVEQGKLTQREAASEMETLGAPGETGLETHSLGVNAG